MNLYGGSTDQPYKIEYNVGDCQGGWAVLKDGTGQVVGCHKTKEEAQTHMQQLTTEPIDILGDEVRTAKAYDATSIWDGVFLPTRRGVMGIDNGSIEQDTGYRSTFNTPEQKDGLQSAGFGNRSALGNANSTIHRNCGCIWVCNLWTCLWSVCSLQGRQD